MKEEQYNLLILIVTVNAVTGTDMGASYILVGTLAP